MTFEQFQATRRVCLDLGTALNDGRWEGEPNGVGLLYLDDEYPLYIEQSQAHHINYKPGQYSLIIGNCETIDTNLESLERILFQYALDENVIFNENPGE